MTRPLALVALALLSLVWIGLAAYRAGRPAAAPPPDNRPVLPLRMAGVNLPTWERNGYDGEAVRESIRQARAIGVQWVALTPTWFVSAGTSCDLSPNQEKTVSDTGLYALMRELDRSGVRVMLKPHVDMRDGTRRIDLRPDDETCFFTAYRQMVSHYAGIADAGGADLYAIGTELAGLTVPRHAIRWREITSSVRRQFRGPLTYAARSGADDRAEFRQIDWWDAVDYIGVDAFFPLSHAEGAGEDFAQAWRRFPVGNRDADWIEDIHAVSRRFNRHVILTQLGYRSATGSARAPWDAVAPGRFDPELQARLYAAARAAWEREFWLEGVFIWFWSPDPTARGPEDTGYTIQGKPASAEVRAWLLRE